MNRPAQFRETLYDVFLAHASSDSSVAEALYRSLSALGVRCFLDLQSLRPGDDWDVELAAAQSSARVTVVLVSPATDRAFYEREEIAAAVSMARDPERTHRVVPVYLEGADVRGAPYGLRIKHSLAIRETSDIAHAAAQIAAVLPHVRSRQLTGRPGYHVDLQLCLDTSASLQPLVFMAKRHLLTVGHDVVSAMASSGKLVERLRVSILQFGCDADDTSRSPFIELPTGAAYLYEAVAAIHCVGAGFNQSRGLDALDVALAADWTAGGEFRRHVVALWTDRDAALTRSLDDLQRRWDEMDYTAKRLVVFAPEGGTWTRIADEWDNCVFVPVRDGGGFSDVDYSDLLNLIVGSV